MKNNQYCKVDLRRQLLRYYMLPYIRRFVILQVFFLTVSSGIGQTTFFGLSQPENYTTPLDSAMLWRQNELYVGKRGMLYKSWCENPLTYTPMMEAAWSYCLQKVPGEKRLYIDGENLYTYALSKCVTPDDSAKYLKKVAEIFDLRIKNLDMINAHAVKLEAQSSKSAVEMLKVYKMSLLENPTKRESDSLLIEKRYAAYLPIVDSLSAAIERGELPGSDINSGILSDFFFCSTNHYIHSINFVENGAEAKERKALKDSIVADANARIKQIYKWYAGLSEESQKKVRDSVVALRNEISVEAKKKQQTLDQNRAMIHANVRSVLTNHYNTILWLTEQQKAALGRDFRPDSTLTEEEQQLKIDSAVAIAAPYDDLLAYCGQNMESVGIRLDEGTLADLDIKYGDSLKVHENDGRWLAVLKLKCESTSDFDPTDSFYDSVSKAIDAYESKKPVTPAGKRTIETAVSPYNAKASAAWASAIKTKDKDLAFKRWLLVLYYYDKAAADDPGRAKFYKKCRSTVSNSKGFKDLKEEVEFYRGGKTMRGETITVDGVTFTARY